MKKHVLCFIVCLAAIAFPGTYATAQDSVIIIRHGEKPAGGDNLSCKGLNRALGLPASLGRQFSIPMLTYVPAMATGSNTKHVRMFETVTPFAVKYGLTVNTKHDETDLGRGRCSGGQNGISKKARHDTAGMGTQ